MTDNTPQEMKAFLFKREREGDALASAAMAELIGLYDGHRALPMMKMICHGIMPHYGKLDLDELEEITQMLEEIVASAKNLANKQREICKRFGVRGISELRE